MIATRGLGAGFGATLPTVGLGAGYGGAPPTPTPTGNRGRRLVRYLWIESTRIGNPLGEWVRQREDKEELFILG